MTGKALGDAFPSPDSDDARNDVFESLQELHIGDLSDPYTMEDLPIVADQLMTIMDTASHSLKTFEIGELRSKDDEGFPIFPRWEQLFSPYPASLSQLENITLWSVVTDEEQMVSFLKDHHTTLKRVSLSFMEFVGSDR